MTDRTSGRSRPRDGGGAGRDPSARAGRATDGGSQGGARTSGSGPGGDPPADDRTGSGPGGAGRIDSEKSGRDRAGSDDRPGGDRADAAPSAADPGRLEVAELSIVPSVLGVHPLAAVGVAAGLTALGVVVDLIRVGTIGTVFTVCYLSGCVLAVAWVRREGLFWPMVVPPLLMVAAVPVVVLLAGSPPPGAGVAQRLLQIGAPLVNGFPMMAWTTGLALALGVFRLITQRLRPARGAARGAARTSASPRRS